MDDKMKTTGVSLRVTPEQLAKLEKVCNHHRRTQSDMIRILIEDEYKRVMEPDDR